jgi:radical SAM superfamily enzyme YgiQ (UPF0313 family)
MSPFVTKDKRPPLGIGFLISVLRQRGHKLFFIDNFLSPTNFLETDYLVKNKIDLVGIYANTICFRDTKRMLNKIQRLRDKKKWNGKIVVGGPHTTVALETLPEFVDYVIQGEGEKAIIDIVEGNVNKRVLRMERIKHLDELPPPAWDYFINLPYDFTVRWFPEKPVFTMNTSRGCPFGCSFCSVGSIWGKQYTYFSPERIVFDIEYLINRYGAKGIYFREDNFTLNKKRVWEFCELILKQGLKIKWACESRVDTLNKDLLQLMHRSGCRAIYIGAESGSQRLLDFINKGITLEQVEKVHQWCHRLGIETHTSFMVGLPTESEAERRSTVEFMQKIKPTDGGINIFVGIPRSPMYEHILQNKLYEYIDDRGLVYLKKHNALVDEFYKGDPRTVIPRPQSFIRWLFHHGFCLASWKYLLSLIAPSSVVNILRKIKSLILLSW